MVETAARTGGSRRCRSGASSKGAVVARWVAAFARFGVCSASSENGTLSGAQRVHVPLREHRAQPGGKLAASVKIVEQRTGALAARAIEPVQLGIERIGEFARAGFSRRADDGARRRIEQRPVRRDELVPRRLGAALQRTDEGEIFEMERAEVGRQSVVGWKRCAEVMWAALR